MRKPLVGLGLGCAAALAAALVSALPFVETVELKTYDWRMRLTADPSSARRDIVMVAIDEPSVRQLDPLVGRWPWPRLVHAALLDYLARAPAKVIVYDVIFAERDRRSFKVGDEPWTGEESDRALAEATARAGNVVHVAEVAGEGTAAADNAGKGAAARPIVVTPYRQGAGFEERPTLVPPYEELARASRALGHNLVVYDEDGPVRRMTPFVRVAGQDIPSLALAAVSIATGTEPSAIRTGDRSLRIGNRALPLVDRELKSFYGERRPSRRALVRFPGGVVDERTKRPTFREYSFYDLFYSEQQIQAGQKPLVDPAAFKGATVLVGTTAPGLFDTFTVPFPGKIPGMQIHASVIDNILSSRFLAPAPAWTGQVVVLAMSVLVGLAILLLGVWRGLAASAVLAAVLLGASIAAFGRGTWLPLTAPGLGMTLSAFAGVAYQYLVEDREKRKVKRLFSRYVPKDVRDQLMADPSRARLGGQRRTMTVLFSDIRGFTTASEQLQPEAIVALLNEYFTRMVQVVFDHHGTLDKFIGDAVMALFGAPLDDPDHADHAVMAALAMQRELADLNRQWIAEGRPALDIGVGVNTGEMVAGNIGSAMIMSYTVIGDAVNLASRLESLNKQYATHVIVSEATRAALRRRYDMRELGDVVVKGKTRPVAIYEVLGLSEDGAPESGEPGPGAASPA